MLEVGWSEILVIALILIIVVGPKELPGMLRTFGRFATRLRGMANEFKGQFDEALREAELDDVRKGISEVTKLNPTNSLREAINPLRQLGQDIKSDLQKASDISLKPDAPMVAQPEDKVPDASAALQAAEPVVAKVETPAVAQPLVSPVSEPAKPKAPRKKAAAAVVPEPVVAEAAPVKKPATPRKKVIEPIVVAEVPTAVSKPKAGRKQAVPKKVEAKAACAQGHRSQETRPAEEGRESG
jgi:sec-independent protein translocase protein TatB